LVITLVVPFLALLAALRPQGGLYRDWDVFAACGVALGIASAWVIGRVLAGGPGASKLAAAVVLGAACSALGWLALLHDTDRGTRRTLTCAVEPPIRPDAERAGTWDQLGSLSLARGDNVNAVAAFRRAVEIAPSPRLLYTMGLALERAGHHEEAVRAFA